MYICLFTLSSLLYSQRSQESPSEHLLNNLEDIEMKASGKDPSIPLVSKSVQSEDSESICDVHIRGLSALDNGNVHISGLSVLDYSDVHTKVVSALDNGDVHIRGVSVSYNVSTDTGMYVCTNGVHCDVCVECVGNMTTMKNYMYHYSVVSEWCCF